MAGVGSTLIGLKGKRYVLTSQKAKGGEGTVFTADDPAVAVKVYHHPSAWTEKKLKCMVKHPLNPYADGVHLLIAWPLDVVYENGTFVGYVMPFVKDTYPIYVLCRNNESHTHDCHEVFPNYNWTNSLAVAYHLAWVVNYIHQHNYIVGDMNSNNIMIHNDGSITILDVDSFDVTDPDTGERFECMVGISEFLAPELQGRDLRRAKFTKHTDEFALAVHIFQLLMGNIHPFNVKVVDGEKRSLPENMLEMNIVNGNCPWVKTIDGMGIPPGAPYITMLPARIQTAFRQVFGYNATNAAVLSSQRISADMWRQLLYMFYQRAVVAGGDLIRCQVNPEHFYLKNRGCEFCRAKQRYEVFMKKLKDEQKKSQNQGATGSSNQPAAVAQTAAASTGTNTPLWKRVLRGIFG